MSRAIRNGDGRLFVVPGTEHNLSLSGAVMDMIRREHAEEAQRVQEREQMQRHLQQVAKLQAIGLFACGIVHDFSNILGAILGYGEIARSHLGEGSPARRPLDQVMRAGAHGKELVERILAFSCSGMDERVPVHVGSVLEETLELLTASLPATVRLERQLRAADTVVVGNAIGVHQIAWNLCTNAVHAMGRKGVLTVVLDRVELAERHSVSQGILSIGSYVRLLVTDTGSGIPQEVLERMFDPFFTTKRTGEGTGLGLSLVHGIVADFGGAIDVVTQVGAGTTFTIWLPATNAAGPPRGIGEAVVTMPVSDCFD